MINKKLRKALHKYGEDNDAEIMLLDNPSFDGSIIGLSYDNRVIYDYNLMISELAKDDHIDYAEAEEFIEYNTLRALPYYSNAPIILYTDRDYIMEDRS